jgi:uncharacterized SAM-binding protein YcdF (DUF218 family)
LIVAVGAMTACLLLPINSWAIRPLEDRFPAVTALPEKVDGIVVLGGAIDEGMRAALRAMNRHRTVSGFSRTPNGVARPWASKVSRLNQE